MNENCFRRLKLSEIPLHLIIVNNTSERRQIHVWCLSQDQFGNEGQRLSMVQMWSYIEYLRLEPGKSNPEGSDGGWTRCSIATDQDPRSSSRSRVWHLPIGCNGTSREDHFPWNDRVKGLTLSILWFDFHLWTSIDPNRKKLNRERRFPPTWWLRSRAEPNHKGRLKGTYWNFLSVMESLNEQSFFHQRCTFTQSLYFWGETWWSLKASFVPFCWLIQRSLGISQKIFHFFDEEGKLCPFEAETICFLDPRWIDYCATVPYLGPFQQQQQQPQQRRVHIIVLFECEQHPGFGVAWEITTLGRDFLSRLIFFAHEWTLLVIFKHTPWFQSVRTGPLHGCSKISNMICWKLEHTSVTDVFCLFECELRVNSRVDCIFFVSTHRRPVATHFRTHQLTHGIS